MTLDPAFGYLVVAGIALLFASAAAHKLRGLAQFTEIFAAYRVLPDAWSRRAAWLIPCLEIAIAAAVLWPPSRHAAALGAAALLLAYASALTAHLLHGRRNLDCGCGGAYGRRPIAAWMVWRNLLLAALFAAAALPWSVRPLTLTDLLTVAAGLLVCVALYAAVDRLFGDVAPKGALLVSTS
jgi:uncharacterized membrane protein